MKTKNIIFSFLVGAAATLSFSSCDDGFDAINTNPNGVLDNKHTFYLTDIAQAIQYGADYNYTQKAGGAAGGADCHQRVKSLGIDVFTQYNMGNAASSSYTANDGWQSVYWSAHYISYLGVLNSALSIAETAEDANAIAIGLTWRALEQALASDYYGVLPFPIEPTDDVVPPYMSVKDQHIQMFTDLDRAAQLFDVNASSISSEPIYGGDVAQWKRFCNTLRVRLAMKLSEVDPELCKTQIKAALTAGGLLASAADDAMSAPYGAWGSIQNPYTYYYGWGLAGGKTTMSKTMEKTLTGIGGVAYNGPAQVEGVNVVHPAIVDPRGSAMFDPCQIVADRDEDKNITAVHYPPTWQGGIVSQNPEAGDYRQTISEMSLKNFSQNTGRSIRVMTYPEACFLLAEAVERGFVTAAEAGGTAESWYNKGVEASFIAFGLTSADAAAYLTTTDKNLYGTSAAYTDVSGSGNTVLEKIVTQRYIAFFPDLSNNIWNDKRRLNLPAMEIPVYRNTGDGTWPTDGNIQNPKNFIQRTLLPQSEPQINKEYYDAAVQMLGGDGDKASTPLWWATGANYCTVSTAQ